MSSQLSIVLTVGLAIVAVLPDRAASIITPQASLAVSAAPFVSPASPPVSAPPIDVVRARPVPAIGAPPRASAVVMGPPAAEGPAAAPGDETEADEASAVHLARRMRQRQKQAALEQLSGEAGKAGKDEKTPVAPPSKSEAAKALPPEPDAWSDAEIIAALKDCLKRLAPLGAEVEIAPAVKQEQCGAPAPVLLKRVGSGANRVDLQPPPMLNCAMVAGLHAWIEETVQPAAQDILGSRIARLRNVSGYACRNRNGTRNHGDRLSEHALANAIDIGSFVTADGRSIDVAREWGPTARDLRRKAIEVAQASAAAAKREREQLEVQVKQEREKLEKDKADLPPAKKGKDGRQEREKAQAEIRRRAAELKKQETALREAEEVEERETERREALERGPLKSAQIQKLGRGREADRRAIPVAGTVGKDDVRRSSEASFLRRLHKGACGSFGTVLGPEANEAHRDHFHLDLAPRRRSAYCE